MPRIVIYDSAPQFESIFYSEKNVIFGAYKIIVIQFPLIQTTIQAHTNAKSTFGEVFDRHEYSITSWHVTKLGLSSDFSCPLCDK